MNGDLNTMIREVVHEAEVGTARAQQKHIGPSEIGDPCDRAILYKLREVEPVNTDRDNWLATLGVAIHAWLADAFTRENARLGRTRFLVEQPVDVGFQLSGTCDLFDLDTGTVIDFKLTGVTKLREIKAGEIPEKYRVQVHAYGYGFQCVGRPPERVALAFLPRNDSLGGDFGGNGLYVWSEPYDRKLAEDALDRLAQLHTLGRGLDLASYPERWELIPSHQGDHCQYCPAFNPANDSSDERGCPGPEHEIPAVMPGIC